MTIGKRPRLAFGLMISEVPHLLGSPQSSVPSNRNCTLSPLSQGRRLRLVATWSARCDVYPTMKATCFILSHATLAKF
jgi:hypothetical protein